MSNDRRTLGQETPHAAPYGSIVGAPAKLAIALLAPMLLLQLFGVPSGAKLFENLVLPANRTLGVARIELAPIETDGEAKSPGGTAWSELLLISHSAPEARDVVVLGSGTGILAVSAGAIEPRPNLERGTSDDPRTKPLVRTKLPRKKLLAAAVHFQPDGRASSIPSDYWVLDGKSEAMFHRNSSSLVTMTKNEYVALLMIFAFATVLISASGFAILKAPKLMFPSADEE